MKRGAALLRRLARFDGLDDLTLRRRYHIYYRFATCGAGAAPIPFTRSGFDFSLSFDSVRFAHFAQDDTLHVITEAWLARAGKRAAAAFLKARA